MRRGIKALLEDLESRLPELEWKISNLAHPLHASMLPRGLFNLAWDAPALAYIEVIKKDLYLLRQTTLSQKTAFFLAQTLHRKISVLVRVCQREEEKTWVISADFFKMKTMTTRPKWLEQLQKDIYFLEKQEKALQALLSHLEGERKEVLGKRVSSDLLKIKKRLDLAKDTYKRYQRGEKRATF